MKNRLIRFTLVIMMPGIILAACKKDSNDAKGQFENGIFISNEGTFGSENGSITYYNPEKDTILNEIFYIQNQRYPGDLVNSLSTFERLAYICARGSDKIEVTDLNFKWIGSITNIPQVRYFIGAGENKGYATSWKDNGSVKIIDLNGRTVTGSINLNHTGPDRMIIDSGKLFIANSGGESVDSTISIIDIASDAVSKTIYLDAYKPTGMLKDSIGNLWVLCQGKEFKHPGGPTPAKLIKIDLQTLQILSSTQLFDDQHPMHLGISPDGQTIYYGAGLNFTGIYKISTTALIAPETPFIVDKFYSMGTNPFDGNIFALESPNYTSKGKLHVYSPEGSSLKNFKVGITPGNINF